MPESEEDAQTIRAVAERLVKEHPHLDTGLVRGSVQTAYEELRYARVRTYLPVLMERRAKDLLPSEEQGNTAPDARSDGRLPPGNGPGKGISVP
ncbi:three-helix bundle dimerization domain-containing protein [Streptomyces sp. NPDC013457]|uniref:three-helix bundle dimerization domain-containing protein n=1 Tax=Streptomyces sp. NPDC013457 TaxID=3364866 RepID=UPI0036FC12D1